MLIAAPCPARADGRVQGLELGMRVGYGIPMGRVEGQTGGSLRQTVSSTIPLGAEIGYRLESSLFLGVYGTYSFASPAGALNDQCSSQGKSCSIGDERVGIQAQIHGPLSNRWDPWVGVGAGYEWLQLHAGSTTLIARGWELAQVEAGVDLKVLDSFGFGPFIALALGQYGSESLPGAQTTVTNKAFHEWLVFGLRLPLELRSSLAARINRED
jgi:hypothetical protein